MDRAVRILTSSGGAAFVAEWQEETFFLGVRNLLGARGSFDGSVVGAREAAAASDS